MKGRIPPGAPGHPRDDSWSGQPGRGAPRRSSRSHSPESPHPQSPASARANEAPPGRKAAPLRSLIAAVEFLYDDGELLAVNKPAGLPVIAPDGGRARALVDVVTERLKRSNPKGRAAVVHRIDRDSSGLVLFAANAAVKRLLMGSWDEIVGERAYVALVEGELSARTGRRESWLAENRSGTVYEAAPRSRGALRAATRWKVLAVGSGMSLLELLLETGRKHQIRVQLAAMGYPVVGDLRYGSRRDPLGRLCLHAERIELALPGRAAPLRIACPAPPQFRAALGASAAPSSRPAPSGRDAFEPASRSATRSGAARRPGPRRGPRGSAPASRPPAPPKGRPGRGSRRDAGAPDAPP